MEPEKTEGKTAFVEKITGGVGSWPSLVVHTFIFGSFFVAGAFHLVAWDMILLILTTAVSLEAIYLAILIQMTVNEHTRSLHEVEEDIEEIQEDVDEIQEDIDEIQEDVDEIAEDVDEIQEDVEEIQEEEKLEEKQEVATLETIAREMRAMRADLELLKKK